MIKRLSLLGLLFLSACATQEELIGVEEPAMEEDIAAVATDECDFGDDDGIGGTGCEPVARMAHPWR